MAKVFGSTYLLNRDGRYYFRRPIPVELRSAFGNRVEFKHSLRTADKNEARAKAERLTVETSQQLEDARRRLNPQFREAFTRGELEAFAKEYVAQFMRSDEQYRHGAGEDELENLALGNSQLIDVVEARPPHRIVREQADDLLRSKAVQMRKDSPGYLEFVEVVRDAMEDALRQVLRRDEGERVSTPEVTPGASLTLSQMLTKWKTLGGKAGAIRPKTADEAKKTVDAFIALHDDLPVSAITKQHGAELRDHFLEAGNLPGTLRKKFGLLNAILTLAVQHRAAVAPRTAQNGLGKRNREHLVRVVKVAVNQLAHDSRHHPLESLLVGWSACSLSHGEMPLVVLHLRQDVRNDRPDVVTLRDPEGVEEGVAWYVVFLVLVYGGSRVWLKHVQNRRPAVPAATAAVRT